MIGLPTRIFTTSSALEDDGEILYGMLLKIELEHFVSGGHLMSSQFGTCFFPSKGKIISIPIDRIDFDSDMSDEFWGKLVG